MRLQVLSDVHLEFGAWVPPHVDSDVLVLAGDVGVGLMGLRWAAEHAHGRPVLYVPGNHEYYRGTLSQVRAVLKAAGDALNIRVLDRDAAELHGVRFLGCTLWTDFSSLGDADAGRAAAHALLNDYEHMHRDDRAPVSPADILEMHHRDRAWLSAALDEKFAGPTVVITHHAPIRASLPDWPRRAPGVVASSVNRMEDLMGRARVTTWIHGHIHIAGDRSVRGTRVLCNPRGYPGRPGAGFDPAFIVDV